ncbi:hypothetical protein OAK75_03260 [Bacteriovoracales bacterium]|nr:hypothetical protein [Bacteriovoracales bacterium]
MKRNYFIILVMMILSSLSSWAAIPNAEGLFRNSNNQDLSGNFVKVDVVLEEIFNNQEGEENRASKFKKKYLKYIFSIDKDKRVKLIQIEYFGKQMKEWEISNLTYFPNIFSKLKKDTNHPRILFYSQLMMFSLNDSRGMSIFLKKVDPDYDLNRNMINGEKIRLLKKYKRYLMAIRKNRDLKKKLSSPLYPSDDEKRLKLKEILGNRTYKETEKVTLIREGGKFYWSLALSKANALFENKSHRIKNFSVDIGDGSLDYEFGQFVSLNGIHEMPQNIYFRNSDKKKYRISFVSYKNFLSKHKKRRIVMRYREWKKKWKNSKEKRINRDLMTTTDFDLVSSYNGKKIFLY